RDRLVHMGAFAAAYARTDGSVPLWGDADDGRALPLGTQAVNDHRYLPALIGTLFEQPSLQHSFTGAHSELLWLLGPDRCTVEGPSTPRESIAFPSGGFYILQGERDHVFVDCGPVGLAGRGGHGHNDALAFEAWLDGSSVIVDSGTYTYTS